MLVEFLARKAAMRLKITVRRVDVKADCLPKRTVAQVFTQSTPNDRFMIAIYIVNQRGLFSDFYANQQAGKATLST
jgi:hypothetical protein